MPSSRAPQKSHQAALAPVTSLGRDHISRVNIILIFGCWLPKMHHLKLRGSSKPLYWADSKEDANR